MKLRTTLLAVLLGTLAHTSAALELPTVIADGMVLQRQMRVPVWGWGKAGDVVTVRFAGQAGAGIVGKDGAWKVTIGPLEASAEGRVMSITVGAEFVDIKDVVVGEVWFCSGQSNMGMTVGACTRKTRDPKDQPIADYVSKELGSSLDPLIRQIASPCTTSYDKELTTFKGSWVKADSADNKKSFTAAGYFFAKELRAKLKVPVGLLKCPWGGKKIQPFIPSTQYKKAPDLAKYYADSLARARSDKKLQGSPNFPSTLYNAMVNPFVPYAIRGALWYQGESNAGGAKREGFSYERYLRALVDGWRDRWGQGDFSFYYCQLAQFRDAPKEPIASNGWVDVCNDMRKVLDHENVGMAVLNDIGEEKDIHPRNKVDAGKRLALWALAKDYGFDIVYSGPLYKSQVIEGKNVRIQFDSVGEGLMVGVKHLLDPTRPVKAELGGFQICGADKKWKWAKAKIMGKDEVAVWHPDIAEPVEVRYAWASNPARANLYNKSGLPTSVFSTKE
jgi:sialate O-acetylesterase